MRHERSCGLDAYCEHRGGGDCRTSVDVEGGVLVEADPEPVARRRIDLHAHLRVTSPAPRLGTHPARRRNVQVRLQCQPLSEHREMTYPAREALDLHVGRGRNLDRGTGQLDGGHDVDGHLEAGVIHDVHVHNLEGEETTAQAITQVL